jgi:tetraacyldisaccharide-1-P 4'-kinase
MGLELERRVQFPDHHRFTDAELQQLGTGIRITTEKDAVKLEGRGEFYVLRVSARLADPGGLWRLIRAQLHSMNRQ